MTEVAANNNEEKQETVETTQPEDEPMVKPDPINPLQKLPVRRYLDQTIVPILLAGMTELIKDRSRPSRLISSLLHHNTPLRVIQTHGSYRVFGALPAAEQPKQAKSGRTSRSEC